MLQGGLAHGSLSLLVLALLAAGLGVPLPEDPILLAAGALAHRSSALPVAYVFTVVYVAVVAADCGLYYLGRRFGDRLLAHRPLRWIATESRRARVRELLERYGAPAIFWGRHLAGLRSLLFVAAGVERVSFRKFLLFDALAALVTVPVVFGLGYLFSHHLAQVEARMARAEHWLIAGLGVLVLVLLSFWSQKGNRPRR